MNKFNRVSSKLIILSLVPLLVFSIIIYAGIKVTTERQINAQQVLVDRLTQTQKLNSVIRTFTSNIIDTSHKARSGMELWSDAKEKVNSGKNIILLQWNEYKNGNLSIKEKEIIKSIKPDSQRSFKAIDKIADLIEQESSYSMGNYIDLKLYSSIEPFLLKLDQLVLLQKQLANEDILLNNKLNKQTSQIIFIAVLVVALLILLISYFIFHSIKKPLQHLKNTMINVEKDSNLSLRIKLSTKDELGEIGQSFNIMMDRIVSFVEALSKIASTLDSATENTIISCREAQGQVKSTQNELSNATTSIEQMIEAVEITQSYTENTITISKGADHHATENFKVIEQSSLQIKQLAEAIGHSTTQMDALREHGQEINSVLTVSRTNELIGFKCSN